MNKQEEVMRELHVKKTIVPKDEIQQRIDFLKSYCKKTGAKGFVLGISGGQDSTLNGRIGQLAAEQLREEGYESIFIAVRLPYGIQQDEHDAQEALRFINPDKIIDFNIEDSVNAFALGYNQAIGNPLTDFHKGNVKARMRMMVQYAIAGEHQCLVLGSDHAAEAVTGFYTKFGDGGADILPLAGLTKGQGRELLIELKATEQLYLKVPTADLLDHKPLQSDEAELGMDYDILDEYLVGNQVSPGDQAMIEKRYANTQHKREMPVTPFDQWWK